MTAKIPAEFNLNNYSYDLPQELIAQRPLPQRDAARMLCLGSDGTGSGAGVGAGTGADAGSGADVIEDSLIKDLGTRLRPGDLLVLNNSKVLPMRLLGRKAGGDTEAGSDGGGASRIGGDAETGPGGGGTSRAGGDTEAGPAGGKVELLINKILDSRKAEALIRARRAPRTGEILRVGDAELKVLDATMERDGVKLHRLELLAGGECQSILELCQARGLTPLPPYIRHFATDDDKLRYQTLYASQPGSAAAPTAGLHFSEELLDGIREMGVAVRELTLHVGIGTFTPIRTQDIRQHKMHPEFCEMPQDLADLLNKTRAEGGRIVAVGTTSLRALESFYEPAGRRGWSAWRAWSAK